jgi:hypothetical protein
MMIAGFNEMDDDNASEAIAEALKNNQSLRILNLGKLIVDAISYRD